jgi:hypothetical protein
MTALRWSIRQFSREVQAHHPLRLDKATLGHHPLRLDKATLGHHPRLYEKTNAAGGRRLRLREAHLAHGHPLLREAT